MIFEAKMAPKMDSGDLQKRVRRAVGNSSAQKGLLDASGAAKTTRNTDLKVVGGKSCFPVRGSERGREGVGSRDRWPRLPGEAHLSKKPSKTTNQDRI